MTIGKFNTVESYCWYFNWLKPLSKLECNSNYHLFKLDIKPMWEDEVNVNSGTQPQILPVPHPRVHPIIQSARSGCRFNNQGEDHYTSKATMEFFHLGSQRVLPPPTLCCYAASS